MQTAALMTLLFVIPAQAQDPISFTKKIPAQGDVRLEAEKMAMDMKIAISLNGNPLQNIQQTKSEDESAQTTILESTDNSITKVLLKVIRKDSAETGPGGEKKTNSPIAGKSFILTKKDKEIAVTDAEGKAVNDDFAKAAREEGSNLFDKDFNQFAKILPDRPIKVGETITIKGEEALELFGGKDQSFSDGTFSLTLKGSKDIAGQKCAEFNVTMSLKGEPQKGINIDTTLKGSMLIDTSNSWPLKMNVTGPMTVKGLNETPQGKISFTGTGTMTIEHEASYSKK